MPQALACRSKASDVEEAVGGDEVFVALVERTLVHALDAGGELPFARCLQLVARIVGEGVELEVEPRLGGTLLVFPALVVLIAYKHLERAVAQQEGIVEQSLIVVDALEGHGEAVGLHVGGVGHEPACRLVAVALDHAGFEVEVA